MGVLKHVAVYALLLLLTSLQSLSSEAEDMPSFQVDLKKFGYSDGQAAEYSSVGFLSNDLLLLVVNQRMFHSGEPLNTDSPASTLIVFSVAKKQALHTTPMAVIKAHRSVALLTTGDFLVVSSTDVKLCSSDLRCEKSFPGSGGLPLDSDNAKSVTGMDTAFRTGSSSTDGTRVLNTELKSTAWNKITHPLGGIDEPTPPDFRRISVYDNRSHTTSISLQYDPKNHVVEPALSPNGAKLAIVRDSMLEVFDLP